MPFIAFSIVCLLERERDPVSNFANVKIFHSFINFENRIEHKKSQNEMLNLVEKIKNIKLALKEEENENDVKQ